MKRSMTIASPCTEARALSVHGLSGMAELTHLGVIRALRPEDAATFLQGQLTQDVTTLEPDRRAAGRLL